MNHNDEHMTAQQAKSSEDETKEFGSVAEALEHSLSQTQPSESFDAVAGSQTPGSATSIDQTVNHDTPSSRPKISGGRKSVVRRVANVDGYLPRRQVDSPSNFSMPHNDLADYRIVGKLGIGGTAIVFQAHQRAVDREVALKYLRPELANDLKIRRRFLHEARVIGSLEHPNIIAIHEVALDCSDEVFYSMKRIEGSPWNEQIDDLDLARNVDILLAIADAVRYAHSQQVIHRDLKPENVMLGRFGEILVADWGMAVRRDSIDSIDDHDAGTGDGMTGDGKLGVDTLGETSHDSKARFNRWFGDELDFAPETSIGGTPAYMAPEMTVGDPSNINETTDVYLLGAILYRIITGHPPHHGNTLAECIRAAADNLIVPTDIQHDLVDIARRAMNTHPCDRQPNVETFVADIRTHRRQQQSMSLVRRVKRGLADIAKAAGDQMPRPTIERLTFLDSLLDEAIQEWAENPLVADIRLELGRHRVAAIADAGDIDGAIELLGELDDTESDLLADLKQRKAAQCKQKRAVSRYSALFVQSPDPGLLVTMPDGIIVEVNERFQNWFGFQREDVVGKTIAQLNLWVCLKRRSVLATLIEQHGLIEDFETRLYRHDGQIIDVVIAGRRVELEGRPMMVATLRDISARKNVENDLRRSRDRMRNLQRMAGLATWSYRIADDTIQWSEELFALFGRDPKDGTPSREEFYELVHPDDRGRLRECVENARRAAEPYEIRIQQRAPEGGYRSVLIRGEPLRNGDGQVDEIYGVSIPDR